MIKVNEGYYQRINRVRDELQKYKIIADYYVKYPFRIKPNESYIEQILEELVDISEKRLPKDLKDSCSIIT